MKLCISLSSPPLCWRPVQPRSLCLGGSVLCRGDGPSSPCSSYYQSPSESDQAIPSCNTLSSMDSHCLWVKSKSLVCSMVPLTTWDPFTSSTHLSLTHFPPLGHRPSLGSSFLQPSCLAGLNATSPLL